MDASLNLDSKALQVQRGEPGRRLYGIGKLRTGIRLLRASDLPKSVRVIWHRCIAAFLRIWQL